MRRLKLEIIYNRGGHQDVCPKRMVPWAIYRELISGRMWIEVLTSPFSATAFSTSIHILPGISSRYTVQGTILLEHMSQHPPLLYIISNFSLCIHRLPPCSYLHTSIAAYELHCMYLKCELTTILCTIHTTYIVFINSFTQHQLFCVTYMHFNHLTYIFLTYFIPS
jgi:hypothetical protein